MTHPSAILSGVDPFATLDVPTLAPLDRARVSNAAAGETLVRAGDPQDGALIVLEGRVTERRADGPTTVEGPGPLLQPGALLAGGPSDTDLVADTAVRVLYLDRAEFEALIGEGHPLGRLLLDAVTRQLVSRVRALNDLLNKLLQEA